MFGSQALRLLREVWPDATSLAQELYAIFDDSNPTTSGPLTINNSTPSGPGLTVNQLGSGNGPALSLNRGNSQVTMTVGPTGLNITTPSGGGLSVNGGSAGGGGMPAKVVGSLGGSLYSVLVYSNGLSLAASATTATQLSIDPAETIPAGTWTTVVQAGDGNFYMQVPTWGAP